MNRTILQLRYCLGLGRGRMYSNKAENINENTPIKFTTSSAAKAKRRPVFAKPNNIPWYQPYSVVGSVAVFLLYFCVLREESDVDREFDKTLYDRLKGLEKQQLLISYRYNKETGGSTVEIEQRLKEIEEAESNALA